MIKKITEKNQPVLGLTEWWELSKNYQAIIYFKNDFGNIQLSDKSKEDLVKLRHVDPTRVVYNILIQSYSFDASVYKLKETAYGTGVINFPIQNKIELLEIIDKVLSENSIF